MDKSNRVPERAHRRNAGEQGISELLMYGTGTRKRPGTKSRVDDYRIRNYRLQQSENVDLYDAVDSLEQGFPTYSAKARKQTPISKRNSEVCKMVQKVQDSISEAIPHRVPEI